MQHRTTGDRRHKGSTSRVKSVASPMPIHPEHAASDLTLAQLLCSRLCHDLIGPSAAINTGEELIREGGAETDAEVHELIADSACQLAGRLAFFRAAFGQGSAISGGITLSDALALAGGFLLGRRVKLEAARDDRCSAPRGGRPVCSIRDSSQAGTPAGDAWLTADETRVFLCLVMLAADALPRGGTLTIGVDHPDAGTRLSLLAAGPRAGLAADLRSAAYGHETGEPTARTVHAIYLSRLIHRCGAAIDIDSPAEDHLTLKAVVPHTQRTVTSAVPLGAAA